MRWWIIGVAGLTLVLASGCGQRYSRVHGKVTFQGKPVAGGSIFFLGEDNQSYSARIGADGSYTARSVPRGKVRVSVQVDTPRTLPRAQPDEKAADKLASEAAKADDARQSEKKGATIPKPSLSLPPRYSDPSKSGLEFDLKEPDQEYTIDLAP
jgi:hypothetical protein